MAVASNVSTASQTQSSGIGSLLSQLIPDNFREIVFKAGGAVIALILMSMVAKVIANIVSSKFLKSTHIDDANYVQKLGGVVHDIVYYAGMLFAVFIAFQIVGFDIGIILGGVSFGIGFAFQEVLGNMIAGIMLLTTKEFKLGDIIEVQSEGFFGRIEEITIRYTVIRTLDLRQIVVPNLTMMNSPLKTYSSEDIVKLSTVVPIHYDSDLSAAIKVIKTAINNLGFVKAKEKTNVFLSEFGDSAYLVKCFFYIDPNGGIIIPVAIGEVNHAVRDALRDANLPIPKPHVTMTVDKDDQGLLSALQFVAKESSK